MALDDRLFHLAADAAHRADRVAFAALGAQQDRLAADVARPFDAGEGMDLHVFVDIDRSMLGIEDDHGMDLGAVADENVVAVAANRAGFLDLAFHAAAAGGAEILGQLLRVGKDRVPRIIPRRQLAGNRREFLFGGDAATRRASRIAVSPRSARAILAARTSPWASRASRLGPSAKGLIAAGFTRASTNRRSAPPRFRGSFTGQVVWRRQTSAMYGRRPAGYLDWPAAPASFRQERSCRRAASQIGRERAKGKKFRRRGVRRSNKINRMLGVLSHVLRNHSSSLPRLAPSDHSGNDRN